MPEPLLSEPTTTRSLGLARPAWNQSRVGMAIVSLDGRLLEVNPAYCEITGFAHAELLGRPAQDLAFVAVQSDLRASLTRLRDGSLDHFTFEHQLRHAEGCVVWINATVSMLRADDGHTRCYIVSITDIGELVAAREEAAEGDRRYRLLFDAISDPAFVTDLEQLRFIEVNDAAVRLYGYSRAEFLAMPVTQISTEPAASMAMLAALRQAERIEFTRTHIKRDGSRFPAEITVGYFEHNGRQLAVSVVRDTTERDIAEQTRRAEAERTRALLAHSSDIITVLDADGTWISSTDAGTRILGSHGDLDPNVGLFDLVHPDDTETAVRAFREVVAGTRGPEDPVVLRIRTVHGVWRYFETVGQNLLDVESVGAIVLNSRDVTERVVAERALAQSEGRYRALAMNSSDLVTIIDIESATFTYVSPSIERMLGYTPAELVGTSGFDLFHPDDIDRVSELATAAFAAGQPAGPLTYRARHRDGSWRWHESILTDLSADPNARGIVTNTRDVTDRVVAEQQMAELTARFQGILDNASDAILSLDAQQNVIMFNKAAEEMFGCPAADVIGGSLSVLLPPRYRGIHHELVDEFRTDTDVSRRMNRDRPEVIGYRRDGTEFPAEITISKLEIAGGDTLLTAIVRDVTARWEAAEALRRSRQELANVLRGATETSIITTSLSGAITLFNRGAERMLGYTAEEMLGRTPTVVHDPAELTERAAELGIEPGFDVIVNFAEHGEAETREWTYVRKDGSRLAVSLTVTAIREEDGTISGYLGVANDLTARKVAEQRFQAAFDRGRPRWRSSTSRVVTSRPTTRPA